MTIKILAKIEAINQRGTYGINYSFPHFGQHCDDWNWLLLHRDQENKSLELGRFNIDDIKLVIIDE